MKVFKLSGILFATTALYLPALAHAQTTASAPTTAPPAAEPVAEVIVTAQKRSENVQSVPINISTVSATQLTQAGITSPSDLQRLVPTFKAASSIGTLATRFSIRGLGSFSNSALEPSVATFIDSIYIPRPASIVNALLDIQSVEVLSGPQGTLFGRNASAGALLFRTGQPTGVYSNDLKLDYSTGNHVRAEDALNIPVNDKVAVRIAGLADIFDGYWTNDLTGRRFGGLDTYEGRISVRSEISDHLVWTARADYQQNKGDGTINTKLEPSSVTPTTLAKLTAAQGGIVPNTDEYSTHNNQFVGHNYIDDSIYGLSSDLAYDVGGYTFRLLDGYYDWTSNQGDGDTAALSVYVLGRDLRYRSRSNSHELQIISPKDKYLDGKLDFIGGLYYFHESFGIRQDSLDGSSFCTVALGGIPAGAFPGLGGTDLASRIAACQAFQGLNPSSRGDFHQTTDSYAAYTQATYKLLSNLDLTGGIRYTQDEKGGSYIGTVYNPTGYIIGAAENTHLGLGESKVTYRGNIAWHPFHDVMVFGTVSTGFKSGGFNNGVTTVVLGQQRIFQPETVTNYEVGVKSRFFDRMLTANATLFRMDINNFQERSIVGLVSSIRNVGQVRQQGAELEGMFKPVSYFSLNASVTYVDSDILKYCNAPLPPYLTGAAPASCPGAPANTQNLAGAPLTYSPKWSGVVGGQFNGTLDKYNMRWTVNTDVSFNSSQHQGTTIDNTPLLIQGGYALLNARLTLYGPSDKWSIGVYARNLTDTGYCSSQVYQVFDSVLGLRYNNGTGTGNNATAIRCLVGAPRVVGVTATGHF